MTEVDRYLNYNFGQFHLNPVMDTHVPNREYYLEKFDILDFCSYCTAFPNLQKLARWVLAIPASEATDERVFSDAGALTTPKMTCLNEETLEEMVLIHQNIKFKQ